MQNLICYVAANLPLGSVRNYDNSEACSPPVLVRGAQVQILFRLFATADGFNPIPLADLSNVASWSFVMDSDYNGATACKIVADNESITLSSVTETISGQSYTFTQVAVPIFDMSNITLVGAIGTRESINLNGELCGYDQNGEIAFIVQIKNFTIRNRILPPDVNSTDFSSLQIEVMTAAGVRFRYSEDGLNWHEHRQSSDRFLSLRVSSTQTWSDAIRITKETNMPTKMDVWGHTELEAGYMTKPAIPYETDATQEDFGVTYTRYLNRSTTVVHRTTVSEVSGRQQVVNEVAYGAWANRASLIYESPENYPKIVNA